MDDFHVEVQKLRETFSGAGPGAMGVSLDKGVELTTQYITELSNFNKRRDELVLAQKLFNLPMTSFPELVEMETDLEMLKQMYELYSEFKVQIAAVVAQLIFCRLLLINGLIIYGPNWILIN